MPTYCNSFDIQNGEKTTQIFVFSYTAPPSEAESIKKQLICLSSCMFYGTRNLSTLSDDDRAQVLREGQEFEGFYVRTKNGTYDYCYKIWTERRLPFPPLNYPAPREEEIHDVIIIDKNKDHFGLAYGPHLAFCTRKELLDAGICLKNLSFPCGGGRAKLLKANENRSKAIPYAAYKACPVPVGSQEDEGRESNVEVEEEEDEPEEDYQEDNDY